MHISTHTHTQFGVEDTKWTCSVKLTTRNPDYHADNVVGDGYGDGDDDNENWTDKLLEMPHNLWSLWTHFANAEINKNATFSHNLWPQ